MPTGTGCFKWQTPAKLPVSKFEMLQVSGVGERKYAKYGERFLEAIKECIRENPELITGRKDKK